MNLTSTVISGSKGPDRIKYQKEYIDKVLSFNDSSTIIIYDATYSLIPYSHNQQVKYYSVDTVLSFLNEIKTLQPTNNKTYILADCYAGLFYSKENINLFINILENQETNNITLVLSARHLEFVPEQFIKYFKEIKKLDEYTTPLANSR